MAKSKELQRNLVSISAKDIDKVNSWYRQVLRFEIEKEMSFQYVSIKIYFFEKKEILKLKWEKKVCLFNEKFP